MRNTSLDGDEDLADMFDLTGKTALVIGGGGGIGSVIARALCDAGAHVSIAGRDREKMRDVASKLSADDPSNAVHVLDARQPAALKKLAEDCGATSILVNCQGTTTIKPALTVTEDDYDAVLDTNLKSVFFACTAFAPPMIGQGGGSIINIASLAAHTGWAQAATYSASKWGVCGLTQSLAAEWGENGVRVNAIAPGFFLTDLNRKKMSDERMARAAERCAMGRMGALEELTGAAIYLASDAARFVSGSTLRVDGGYLSSGI